MIGQGDRPEAALQRIIIALASVPRYDRVPQPPKSFQTPTSDLSGRQAVVDTFIERYTQEFSASKLSSRPHGTGSEEVTTTQCVLVTGATGSLGSHLVANLVALSTVKKVICLNRKNSTDYTTRQRQALESKGIYLDPSAISKLEVYDTDTTKPLLGLTNVKYLKLANSVTHIVHRP